MTQATQSKKYVITNAIKREAEIHTYWCVSVAVRLGTQPPEIIDSQIGFWLSRPTDRSQWFAQVMNELRDLNRKRFDGTPTAKS